MGPRPKNLDLNNENSLLRQPKPNFYLDLPSPRTGDVPPALSPLDAFALHSRMLARKFEEEAQNGRRMSRLPPMAVASELAKRPEYFRSASGGSDLSGLLEMQEEDQQPGTRGGLTVAGGGNRPMSHSPVYSNARSLTPSRRPLETPDEFFDAIEDTSDYFGVSAPRESSPEPVDPRLGDVEAPSPVLPSLTHSVDSVQSTQPRTLTNESTNSKRQRNALAPPKSPRLSRSPWSMQSIRSLKADSGDEDGSSAGDSYGLLSSRKLSGSSGMSRPHYPLSPFTHPVQRSPSMNSEYSSTGSALQRPLHNYSRPISSSGGRLSTDTRPSFESRLSTDARLSADLPMRHASGASKATNPSSMSGASRQGSNDRTSTPFAVHDLETPSQLHDEDYFSADSNPAPTYTYVKFALPRGRKSIDPRDSWIQHQFKWEEPKPVPRKYIDGSSFESGATAPSPARSEHESPNYNLPIRQAPSSSIDHSESADPYAAAQSAAIHKHIPSSPSVTSESTDRTIRVRSPHRKTPSLEITPEEHLETGIQCHSSGALSKSTYHLRLAAMAGLPTAMLLYALACRHGWGMRPNQEEGVQWLRKAIDGSGLEVTEVEDQLAAARTSKANGVEEAAERRKMKAQSALATYELGISYMKGWGIRKDKALALRCYEIAGAWGDADALAECGFCYTQGVGCKKDVKKAAAFYREAADAGMSMAGNSWIYKPKYMDDSPALTKRPETPSSETKTASRSRARTFFVRKKALAVR